MPSRPDIDQRAWRAAIAEGDVLDGRGPATHWREKTKATNVQHYGRWLTFLQNAGLLDPKLNPLDRVTSQAVAAYAEHLKGIVAPRTRLSMMVGLKVTMQAMAPDRDWRWLQDACNRIQRTAKPIKDKRSRMRSTLDLIAAGLAELQSLPSCPLSLRDATAYRDAFMMALLANRPLRRKNFTAIEIGRHLTNVNGHWLLAFPGNEMKNGQPIEFFVPDELTPWLNRYLVDVRPVFPAAAGSTRLWLSKDGPAAPGFVYLRITKLTRRLLGVEINPHLFRDCAASSLAVISADAARAAAPLLGHRHFSTTERFYIQADNLEASRLVNGILARVRSSLEDSE